MIKLIYFDIGDVIVDCGHYFQKVCKDFNLDFDDFLAFYIQHKHDLINGKIKTGEFWRKCVDYFHLKSAEDYDFVKWWVSDYKPVKPIGKFIHNMAKKIEIGVISNINSGMWEEMIKTGLIPDIKYQKILLSCNLGIKKPNREIYELAQSEYRVRSEQILFVDNQEKNLVIPREMGWNTLLFDQTKPEEGVSEITKALSAK
ncbi:MAG: hypothetical protein WAV41_01650 [Microgenomates group bacterium]